MPTQNLFKERNLVKTTIAAISIGKSDLIYEIEPEDELVSSELALSARKVVLLVKQLSRSQSLSSYYQGISNIEVRDADFLRIDIPDYSYKVFANLTSSVPSEVIKKLISAKYPPQNAFLLTTEDTASRYSGSPKETETSVLIKPWFEITIARRFRKSDFEPLPALDVNLVDLKLRKNPLVTIQNINIYRNFIKYSYAAGKKGLDRGYAHIFTEEQWKRITKDIDVKLSVKPMELAFEQWIRIFEYFLKFVSESKRMPLLKKKVK